MTAAEILRRLRHFLLGLSLILFVGAVIELWLVQHTQDAVQWIAFVFCGMGGIVVVAFLLRRTRGLARLLRVCMLVVFAGGGFGIYQHVANNIAFEREIRPAATTRELMMKGLSGANPLLAPGILSVAALLALAAAYRHPAQGEAAEPDVLT